MTTSLLHEWVPEAAERSRREAEILERFVASPERMIGRRTESEAAAVLEGATAMALAAARLVPRAWSHVAATLTGLTREEADNCVAANLALITNTRRFVAVIRELLTKFPPSVHVLDADVLRSLDEADAKMNETRFEVDRVATALAMPRPPLDAVKVSDALRKSRDGGNVESADLITAIQAARN